jgi:NAD(P)H-dependent flavin oxidoreductase YrpB (nitropropane dioxygenase family)
MIRADSMRQSAWIARWVSEAVTARYQSTSVRCRKAPMAGCVDARMVAAVSQAGGLGSLPSALLNAERVREEVAGIRALTSGPAAPTRMAFDAEACGPEKSHDS